MKGLKQGAVFTVGKSRTKSPGQCEEAIDSCFGLVTPYQNVIADSSRQ